MGIRYFEIGRKIYRFKIISKIIADTMEGKPVQIITPRGPGMGPGAPQVYIQILVVPASVNICESAFKLRHS